MVTHYLLTLKFGFDLESFALLNFRICLVTWCDMNGFGNLNALMFSHGMNGVIVDGIA